MDTLRGKFGLSAWDDDTEADDLGLDDNDDGLDMQPPPSPVGQDERRMQVRAYNFWAGLLQDRSLPCIEDLEPETLDDFGPFSVLLDFTSGIENPAVPFLGTSLAGECDASGEIETLNDVPGRSLLSRITDHYMQILANKAPIGFEAEFVNQRGATVLYRGILLPFSSDDDTIDFIYGVINWKEVADQITTDALLLEIDNALEESGAQDDVHNRTEEPMADWADGPENEADASEAGFTAGSGEEAGQGPGGDSTEDRDAGAPSPSGMPMPSFGLMDEGPEDTADFASDAMAARLLSGGDYDDEDDFADDSADMDAETDSDNPDDWSTPLSSLIKPKSERGKKLALGSLLPDAGSEEEAEDLPQDVLPQATDDAPGHVAMPVGYDDTFFDAAPPTEAGTASDSIAEPVIEPVVEPMIEPMVERATEKAPLDLSGFDADEPFGEEHEDQSADDVEQGLYDCLAAARELAQAARSSEDRSRNALYAAVGRAYDVSLAAEDAPEDFEELVAENGLTVQDRAPMTPVVKLVFGADYDKTRLTEYAAVLSHAHRLELDRGSLSDFLSTADGGLKGVVQAERRLRREESGKPVADPTDVRESLAEKLREIDHRSLDDIASEGSEFGVVMIRRLPTGEVVLVGEVEGDVKLTEKVARKLVG